MAKVDIKTRRYAAGDAASINELYLKITGHVRNEGDFQWQWLDAPSGPGDMFLIEDHAADQPLLVGHHGVMPVAFSRGDEDLLFGKTENTMVLPHYRNKMLYLRHEKRFLAEYHARYHAVFSTIGPPAAIRMRKALGYVYPVSWQHLLMPVSSLDGLRVSTLLLGKFLKKRGLSSSPPKVPDLARAGFLDASKARQSAFFRDYWPSVRGNWHLTPRRNWEDLNWRFWSCPHLEYYTFQHHEGRDDPAYVIFSVSPEEPGVVDIGDFSVSRPDAESITQLFRAFKDALKTAGIRFMRCSFTSDMMQLHYLQPLVTANSLLYHHLTALMSRDQPMPRLITDKGRQAEVSDSRWNVSNMIFEGRR